MATEPSDLGAKLDILIRLQATYMISSLPTQREKITFLYKAGLSTAAIALALSMSSDNVSKALYRIKQTERARASATKADGDSDGQ